MLPSAHGLTLDGELHDETGAEVARNDRYVVPNETTGGWDVVKDGHRRATAHAETKAKAVARARDLIRREGGGQLRVMSTTGKIVASNTVKRDTGAQRPRARKAA